MAKNNLTPTEKMNIKKVNKTCLRNKARYRREQCPGANGRKCWICDTTEKLEVVHFVSLKEHKRRKSKAWKANHIDNTGWLCKICHTEYDNQDLPRSRVKQINKNGYLCLERHDNKFVIIGTQLSGFLSVCPVGKNPEDYIIIKESTFATGNGPQVKIGEIVSEDELQDNINQPIMHP